MLSIIASIGQHRELGKNNGLLWDIPDDLKHFRQITYGHPIIMGRKTYESIGRALPGRTNIIVTRNKDFSAPGSVIFDSLTKAISFANTKDKQVFVIGGGEIYQQAIAKAQKLYLTIVQGKYQADTFFPDYSEFKKVISKSALQTSGKYKFRYVVLKRI